MAWNEPGNRGESPWGKKRPAGKSGGSDNPLKDWQQRLQALLSGGSGDGSGGGADGPTAPGNFGLIIAAVLVVLWLVSGWFQINASDKGVVQRFGRFTEVRNEGWGWAFPWPIETVTKVNVSQVNSVEYRSRMLTADVNLVEIRSAIQYVNIDPVKVLFQVRDVEATLREVSESAIREVVGQASLDDVLGAARQRITDETRERIQRTLDGYNSGLRISSVNFTDVQVPDAVVAAQRDANKAIEDRERFSKEALAYTNDRVPKAEGDAQRLILNAEAYKAQVLAQAEGDVARFNSVYSIYAQAPEVTRQRMYIEAIEQIMQQSKKIILD
ncbi:MAG TPA: FtsH protease activity modulator HflK, partial [Steroidobacteraceae bacterium]|nr:FtsH protease activity modulator HflK [Steroidobacteraceae bacterium]